MTGGSRPASPGCGTHLATHLGSPAEPSFAMDSSDAPRALRLEDDIQLMGMLGDFDGPRRDRPMEDIVSMPDRMVGDLVGQLRLLQRVANEQAVAVRVP